jgi:hypothetical protein
LITLVTISWWKEIANNTIFSVVLLPLGPTYCPQHPVLKYFQSTFFLYVEISSFTTKLNNR